MQPNRRYPAPLPISTPNTMKSIFAVAALVASAMAQGVVISAPPPLATLTAGETTVVEVVRPVRPWRRLRLALQLAG